jgi:hypothetical protein
MIDIPGCSERTNFKYSESLDWFKAVFEKFPVLRPFLSMVAYRCHKKIHKIFIYFFYLFLKFLFF